MSAEDDEYENLLVTDEFEASLQTIAPALTDDELDGILDVLDELDAAPAKVQNRLHLLDRELAGWWSLTPATPPRTLLRILLRPENLESGGVWRLGPVTRHYEGAVGPGNIS